MSNDRTGRPCSTCGKPWSPDDFLKGKKRQCKACWKSKHAQIEKCCTCGKPWSEEAFHKGNRQCKQCRRNRYLTKHRDQIEAREAQRKQVTQARQLQKLESHRERERIKQERRAAAKKRKQERYEANRTYWQAYGRNYYANNRSRYKRNKAKWLKNNPDKQRASKRAARHRRRAMERGAGGSYTVAQAEALFTQQRGRCADCKVKMTIKPGPRQRNLDHVHPLALRGSNSIENLQWLCQKCNNEKGAMDPYEWAKLHGRLFS